MPHVDRPVRIVGAQSFVIDRTLLAHEVIGRLCLGIDRDDPQRWG